MTPQHQIMKIEFESPAFHPSVTRLFQRGAIESPASRRKIRVLCEAVLARGDWPLLYDKLAISNTYLHAKNRNDIRPITLSKVAFLESGISPSPSWEAGDCSHLPPMAHRDLYCLKIRFHVWKSLSR